MLITEGFAEARVLRRQDLVEAAHLTAGLSRTKRLPRLHKLLPKLPDWRRRKPTGRPRPVSELRGIAQMWNAVLGGTVETRKRN